MIIVKTTGGALSSALTKLSEEIDNLSLLLVIADPSDTSSLNNAMSIIDEITLLAANSNLPPDEEDKINVLITKVKKATDDTKFQALKDLTSAIQLIITRLPHEELTIINTQSTGVEGFTETQTSEMELLCESLYLTHKSLIDEIKLKFTEIQNLGDNLTIPHDLHESVESYALRLNQDANKISNPSLIELAQGLFTLLMEYKLVNIWDEFEILCSYILQAFKKHVSDSSQPIPSNIKDVLSAIELKLSGKSPESNRAPELSETTTVNEIGEENDKTYIIEADAEILSEFVAEAQDHLNAVEGVLLERSLDFTIEDVDTLFRGVHSLKGTSSYFNLLEINESSHLLENILDEVRKGTRVLDNRLKNLVLRYVDIQNTLLRSAHEALQNGGIMRRSTVVSTFIKDIEDFFNNANSSETHETQDVKELLPYEKPENDIAQEKLTVKTLEVTQSEDSQKNEALSKQSTSKENLNAKSFVKIDTERLDSLGEMIGEIVIYSSMLIRRCRTMLPNDESTMRMSDQVEKFSRELQDIGMSMRLDPIRGLFQKLSRLVWDTSKKLGKEVKFVVRGEDTELDRNVIERLADPLMHMVRNSLDHGIEDPETRMACGKDRVGLIELSSSHEGGSILIKIKDDGRGLDPDKLLHKAIEKGIILKDANLTDQEIFQLIFAPGFSTAEKVTDISGRGVGMDVVRTNIEMMRGRIQIDSILGKGSTFTIELPLTLAIIEGIEASVGNEKFIFPMLSVVELIKPSTNMISSSMHVNETFVFRGKHLPLFRLSNIFRIPSAAKTITDARVIILNNGGEHVALLVDEIGGNCQTVIKNLGPMFGKQSGIAGCAIVNNGDIGLIIDVRSLVQMAKSEPRTTKLSIAKVE